MICCAITVFLFFSFVFFFPARSFSLSLGLKTRNACVQRRAGLQMSESATSPVGSVDHLSPPSTSSRLSDSEPDPSDLGDGEEGGGGGGGGSGGMGGGPLLPPSRHTRGALERSVRSDGASVSSMGSSSRYSFL